MIRRPPRSTLLPDTTLSRSGPQVTGYAGAVIGDSRAVRVGGPPVPGGTPADVACERSSHSLEIGRAHVCTPVTPISRMPASACKKKPDQCTRRNLGGHHGRG